VVGRKEARRILVLGGLVALAWLAAPSSASADTNVTISSAATSVSYGVFPASCNNFAAPTGNTANIQATDLAGCLLLGNVVVATSSGGTNPGAIMVSSQVQPSAGTNALTLNAGGAVTQTAPLMIPGNTTVNTASSPITLDNTSNDFGGTLSLTNSGANDASVADTSGLTLGASSVGGNLSVTAHGAITQSGGSLVVNGTSSFDAGSASISLSAPANDFGGAVNLLASGSGDATVNDTNGLTLGAVQVGHNLTVNASGDVTQSNSANVSVGGLTTIAPGATHDIDLHVVAGNDLNQLAVPGPGAHDVSVLDSGGGIVLAGITASHDVTVSAPGGAITQTAPITAPGTMLVSTDSAVGDDATLADAMNDFGTFTTSNVHDVSVTDANAINLGGVGSAFGNVSVTAPGGITQSGDAVSAQGTATFNAGSSNDVTLGLANTFPGLRLTAQNATVSVGGFGTDLGPSQITHNLTLTAPGGAITQSGGPLTVPNTASFSSPAGVTVADPANDFGTLVVGGAQATVKDANGIVLGASTLTGGLGLQAKGPITQSGALHFAGSSSLDAGAASDVTLPNPANSFALLAIPNARDALIDVTGDTNLGAVSTARDLRVENASGDITAGQAISVGRNATFDTGTGDDVAVPSGGNQFGGDVTVSARSATVNAGSALSLGGTLTGTLDAAAASITQAGAITVGHTATLVSGPGGVTLPSGANDFLGPVRLSTAPGQNGTVTDSNDLTLGQSTVGGNLLATAEKTLAIPASTEVHAVGTATLVSDAKAPAAPAIGDGGVAMGAGANLQSSGGPIALYTAKRGQNSIDPTATLNGSEFKPGPLFINTNREVWGTYYPSGSAISPFTIFYKDKGNAAPQTKLKHPRKRWVTAKRHAKIKYAFTSPTPHALFLCKLDRRPLRLCRSPFHASVKTGKHKFLVRAELGTVVDPTPAKVKFKVVRR
jgi:hypothetical protein